MKIAVISDIHDNVWKLGAALEKISEIKPDALICCGDLCSPFVVGLMSRALNEEQVGALVPIHIVFGNNDADLYRINQQAVAGQIMFYGELAEFLVQDSMLRPRKDFVDPDANKDHYFDPSTRGKRVAVNHFDYLARPIAASGAYDVVFYGHNHRLRHEQSSTTVAINPGAIMGYDGVKNIPIPSTFVIYDTAELKDPTWYQIVASSVKDGVVQHRVDEFRQVPVEPLEL